MSGLKRQGDIGRIIFGRTILCLCWPSSALCGTRQRRTLARVSTHPLEHLVDAPTAAAARRYEILFEVMLGSKSLCLIFRRKLARSQPSRTKGPRGSAVSTLDRVGSRRWNLKDAATSANSSEKCLDVSPHLIELLRKSAAERVVIRYLLSPSPPLNLKLDFGLVISGNYDFGGFRTPPTAWSHVELGFGWLLDDFVDFSRSFGFRGISARFGSCRLDWLSRLSMGLSPGIGSDHKPNCKFLIRWHCPRLQPCRTVDCFTRDSRQVVRCKQNLGPLIGAG